MNPPQIEEDLIGLLLAGPERYFGISETLKPEHFVDPVCSAIYAAIAAVHNEGSSFALSLVEAHCRKSPRDISMDAYLARLLAEAPEGVDEESLADEMISLWYRRTFKAEVAKLSKLADDLSLRGDGLIEAAVSQITSAFDRQNPDDVQSVGRVAREVFNNAVGEADDTAYRSFETGLTFVDELLGPLYSEELIVVGAPTSGGKSALVQQIAWTAAYNGIPTNIISNEMSRLQVGQRICSQLTGIDLKRIVRKGALNQREIERLLEASNWLENQPLIIDGRKRATVGAMRLRVMRHIRQMGVRLVIIDHLQFVVPDRPRDGLDDRISQVTSDIKSMAKELGIVVILVSHFNREMQRFEVKTAADIRRPRMADLYGSGSIEKDADGVLLVHRPAYFLERNEPPEGAKHRSTWELDMKDWADKAEIIKVKRRQDEGYRVSKVLFDGPATIFRPMNGYAAHQDIFAL